ncbi:serine protease [Candidatus Parcubacteria bacterium]|nr:serine protease [Candidatus Parcubacteria bacterium]
MTSMEELNKTQIILLTLLVSFVTSIATGIITTSLLAQAPASVTQTINRVVEHTIETVAPNSGGVKEVTVVKEEDSIITAIDKAAQSFVRISGPTPEGGTDFYALGAIVSPGGLVVSDRRNLVSSGVYKVTLADGSMLDADINFVSEADNLVLFKIHTDPNHKTFTPIPLSQGDLKLGQSVIALEGKDKNAVAVGRVLSLDTREEANAKGEKNSITYAVDTDITSGETQGGALLNLSGELVGIKSSLSDLTLPKGTYSSILPVRRLITQAK